jgi:hypothetical protein
VVGAIREPSAGGSTFIEAIDGPRAHECREIHQKGRETLRG